MKYSFFRLLLVAFLFSNLSISFAQQRTISGSVTTFKKIAVANAEVKVFSSKETVLTDSLGRFEVTCLEKDKLKVSAKGFKSAKIIVDEELKKADVDLIFNGTEKNVDQAVGYGYIKEEDKSYAISTIKSNQSMNFAQYTNIVDVIVNSSTSVAYQNGGFVIRGGSSLLSSNHALIIIDGNQSNMTQLNSLTPLDVKSVDILKGAASSMYGSRGANGVILVYTKKGNENN